MTETPRLGTRVLSIVYRAISTAAPVKQAQPSGGVTVLMRNPTPVLPRAR